MSNVLKFLEQMAGNPEATSNEQLNALIAASALDEASKLALYSGDTGSLARNAAVTCCVLFPADNEEPKEGEDDRRDDEQDAPARENSALAA